MRYFLYIVGYMLFVGGLAWAALEAGAPMLWVQIGGVILLGLGLIGAANRARSARVVTSPPVVVDGRHS